MRICNITLVEITEALARECPSAMKAALGIFLAIMAGGGADAGAGDKEGRRGAIPRDTIKEIASGPTISNCNGCQRRFAQMVGANWAAWGTVQKVSNLILNINVYMEDAVSGKMKFARSVDIRGNTDESWRRGLDYLLRNYLLREP